MPLFALINKEIQDIQHEITRLSQARTLVLDALEQDISSRDLLDVVRRAAPIESVIEVALMLVFSHIRYQRATDTHQSRAIAAGTRYPAIVSTCNNISTRVVEIITSKTTAKNLMLLLHATLPPRHISLSLAAVNDLEKIDIKTHSRSIYFILTRLADQVKLMLESDEPEKKKIKEIKESHQNLRHGAHERMALDISFSFDDINYHVMVTGIHPAE